MKTLRDSAAMRQACRFLAVAVLFPSITLASKGVEETSPSIPAANHSLSIEQDLAPPGVADESAEQVIKREGPKLAKDASTEVELAPLLQRHGSTSAGARTQPWYQSTIVSLLIVVGLIMAVAWLVRRIVPGARAADTGLLRVIARSQLSQKQTVAMIQVGDRIIVSAVSPGRVDRLCEVSDSLEVAKLLSQLEGSSGRRSLKFNTLLGEQMDEFADDCAEVEGESRVPPTTQRATVGALLARLRALQKSA